MRQLQIFKGSEVSVEGSDKRAYGLDKQKKGGVVCGELERGSHGCRIRGEVVREGRDLR